MLRVPIWVTLALLVGAVADETLPTPPGKCVLPPHQQRWVFWCNCARGSFAATYGYASILDDAGAAVLGFLCVQGKEGGVPSLQDDSIAMLWSRFGHRSNFFVRETKKDDGTWDATGVDALLAEHRVTHLYAHKCCGRSEEHTAHDPKICNVMHYMFDARNAKGDVVLKISPEVGGSYPVLGLPVLAPRPEELAGPDLRGTLGIPANATVFGQYGGPHSFAIECVQDAVCRVAKKTPRIWFLFANSPGFKSGCEKRLRNVVMLPALPPGRPRVQFIKTADAMLHGRGKGETFGVAVAEFSAMNKPVFTISTKAHGGADAHIDILGDKAQLYTCDNVEQKLAAWDRDAAVGKDWNAYKAHGSEVIGARLLKLCCGWDLPSTTGRVDSAVSTGRCRGGRLGTEDRCVCPDSAACVGTHCSIGRSSETKARVSGYVISKCADCRCGVGPTA